ncbi:hypothetical protein PHLCEN_2v2259 [Hermanssonia centrifuga]|uniref:Uncharacterized protein n=1 Tax=Hermanssonia centrifuga TaxID=98765 RepID=A0A2R6RPS1_9APHY|nr:hypothetical protein PHLCEN_2v2259 [Hermanssonia centrifuga]
MDGVMTGIRVHSSDAAIAKVRHLRQTKVMASQLTVFRRSFRVHATGFHWSSTRLVKILRSSSFGRGFERVMVAGSIFKELHRAHRMQESSFVGRG